MIKGISEDLGNLGASKLGEIYNKYKNEAELDEREIELLVGILDEGDYLLLADRYGFRVELDKISVEPLLWYEEVEIVINNLKKFRDIGGLRRLRWLIYVKDFLFYKDERFKLWMMVGDILGELE